MFFSRSVFFSKLLTHLRRKKVYALIGPSGSGKSFRAHLLVRKYEIDLLIDDGLLIRSQRMIGGNSAKYASNYREAMRTAIFEKKEHRQSIINRLRKEHWKSILILGTSRKMIELITDRLLLPHPQNITLIDSIAKKQEIAQALDNRTRKGTHVVPLPIIEVKQKNPHIAANAIRIFFSRHFFLGRKRKYVDKTIVRPLYSHGSLVTISEEALSQMIMHCIEEFDPIIKMNRLKMIKTHRGYNLNVYVNLPFKYEIPATLASLRDYTVSQIQQYSRIRIDNLKIIVDSIRN